MRRRLTRHRAAS